MRTKLTARGLVGALALTILVLPTSAIGGVSSGERNKPKPTLPGPAHWSGPNGTHGNWGKVPIRTRKKGPVKGPQPKLSVDNLTNPANNEIMPGTTDTYVIF